MVLTSQLLDDWVSCTVIWEQRKRLCGCASQVFDNIYLALTRARNNQTSWKGVEIFKWMMASQGPSKKRKVSNLTANDTCSLLSALGVFQSTLDEDDDELPQGLISSLEKLRAKLEVGKVRTPSFRCLPLFNIALFSAHHLLESWPFHPRCSQYTNPPLVFVRR